ncbi:MAG: DUF362 domain-containing protein [Treponemataceae bacterium]
MTNQTALLACANYNEQDVAMCIDALMNLVPPPNVENKIVLLKPNILQGKNAQHAICTHPFVVAGAIKAFLKRGAKKVLVGESPATANPLTAAKASGIYDATIASGGIWVNFENPTDIPCPNGSVVKTVQFAQIFSEVDVIVSIAKLKTHQMLAYTGAMKNLFGLVVGLQKAQSHFRFSKTQDFAAFITDINLAAKASYAIMDGIIAMEGHGPASGNPVKLGFLASSDNILALDWHCSSIIGYNPLDILNLKDALARDFWGQVENFTLTGDKKERFVPSKFKRVANPKGVAFLTDKHPKILHVIAKFIFTKIPTFIDKKCIRCSECVKICPAKVLSLKDDKKNAPSLNKKNCIHCYCCHEVCPVDAIKLKRSF